MNLSLKKSVKQWLDIILDISWAQWNRLGLMGTGKMSQHSIDIEAALVLAAVTLRYDFRLLEGVYSWLKEYSHIVNGERLAMLIRCSHNEEIGRVLGGLIGFSKVKKLNPALKACQKLCSKNWKSQTLLFSREKKSWKKLDAIWKEWGLIVESIEPRRKLNDHQKILAHNVGLKYRYLYGPSLRADILYLLSISCFFKNKKEIDYITTVRLADVHLGCNRSSVYRIQKDLENGGVLVSQNQLKNQHIVTWRVKDKTVLLKQQIQEGGLIRWISINDAFFKLFKLIKELETLTDENIIKFKINEFHSEAFPLLSDHHVDVPMPFGDGMGPLREVEMQALASMTTDALNSFIKFLVT